ncbi:GvpL/GvpF family gas vesicle protein [Cereibacter johrii]|uniref:GvpL/GvpF family gas vesicle protein n=1 Tax=Cereibacter johrii TaxID=445629 RepID=UPI002B259BE6|nr:GvpL/GvpF family gas vesicle protein [Cereibacter johrii]MEA5163041.1 GvpL/GvpF family gas vesicle protein [Cereibacter johrii]
MRLREIVAVLEGHPPSVLPEGTEAVCEAGLTAILGSPPGRLSGRRALLEHAARRQAVLERLMACGTVLPALSGIGLTPAEAAAALAANGPRLRQELRRLAGRVQFQVLVQWDARLAPTRTDPEETAEDLRLRFADRIAEALAGVAEQHVNLPLRDDLLANQALLLPQSRTDDLDRSLEQIDALWTEGLRIRQIGPSPPVSFASLTFRRVASAAIRRARHRFGLEGPVDPIRLRALRRDLLLRAAEAERAEILAAADVLDLLTRCAASGGDLHLVRIWSEGQAVPADLEDAA